MFLEACSGMHPERNCFQECELLIPHSEAWVAPGAGPVSKSGLKVWLGVEPL